jgi:hypothetical protein
VRGHEATLNHRVRYFEPSTQGLEMGLHNLVPPFDRGPGMPYVERNFREAQTTPTLKHGCSLRRNKGFNSALGPNGTWNPLTSR